MLIFCIFITVICLYIAFVLFFSGEYVEPNSLSCLTFTNDLRSDLLNVFLSYVLKDILSYFGQKCPAATPASSQRVTV